MESNLKRPAAPITEKDFQRYSGGLPPWSGFTKLELASLMIAQGMAQKWGGAHANHIATESIAIAKAVLEEANK